MSACATPGCDGEPQWPSIRRSQTWCAACLAGFAHARGYSTEHTLTEPKQRWLLTADRSAAVVLERVVLDHFRLWPAEVHVGHFPQGGWTECWSTAAGRPALADVLADLLASSR